MAVSGKSINIQEKTPEEENLDVIFSHEETLNPKPPRVKVGGLGLGGCKNFGFRVFQ